MTPPEHSTRHATPPHPLCAARRRGARAATASLLLGAVLLLGGCPSTTEVELRRDIERLQNRIDTLENQISAQQETIRAQRDQLDTARALTGDQLQHLFKPETISIGKLSGGYDRDDQPGDDGIVVYLSPLDQYGDVLKAAGDIRIELFDLAHEPDTRLAVYLFPGEDVAKLWYEAFSTRHYTLHCPWPEGRLPRNPEITIRATFRDFLTERVMTAVETRTVSLPGQTPGG